MTLLFEIEALTAPGAVVLIGCSAYRALVAECSIDHEGDPLPMAERMAKGELPMPGQRMTVQRLERTFVFTEQFPGWKLAV